MGRSAQHLLMDIENKFELLQTEEDLCIKQRYYDELGV